SPPSSTQGVSASSQFSLETRTKNERRTKNEERRTVLPSSFSVGYCDQFGYLFMPDRVIWRRFFPSRSIRKICSFPARVDVNARCRPLGENAGLSLLPMPSVTVFAPRFWKSKILMSNPAPVRDAYAISLNGDGDHVGRSHHDSLVILRGSD